MKKSKREVRVRKSFTMREKMMKFMKFYQIMNQNKNIMINGNLMINDNRLGRISND